MIIHYGDGERVRKHEWQDLLRRFGGPPPMTASYGGDYGVGKPTRGKEGLRFWRRYTKARRGTY